MDTREQILVLDDEKEWLEVCRELLSQLPSKPDIRTESSGMGAMALLDAEPFRLLVCDLKLPQMDGLQVLSVVRRRFPDLRTVALTGFADEDFRSRAYALGVDLFWLKSDMQQNPQMFLECIESLLGREDGGGFRDVKAKNLLDVIQMEMALRNSSMLRITSGWQVAHVWMEKGQLVDVRAEGADGEAALRLLLNWKSGTFESLPAEPSHVRTITRSVDAILLESVQTVKKAENPTPAQEEEETKFVNRLTAVAYEGAEFVVAVPVKKGEAAKGWGIKDVDRLAAWARQADKSARRLGEKFNAGPLTHITGHNLERHLVLTQENGRLFAIGWPLDADAGQLFERSKRLAETWAS
jgi:CheY-like chemotaxis protein